MAKNRKNVVRTKRTPRGTNRRRRGFARMSATPPLVPFNRRLTNSVYRSSITQPLENNKFITLEMKTSTLLAGYPNVANSYKEMKIRRVKIWAYTTLSTSSSGIITMIVSPVDLKQNKTTAVLAAACPGSITRKSWQPLHGAWFPTEPTERDWYPISDAKLVFYVQFFPHDLPTSDKVSGSPHLQIIFDAHVQLRGQVNSVVSNPVVNVEYTPYDEAPSPMTV